MNVPPGLPLTSPVYDSAGRFPSDCTGPAGSVGPPLPGTDAFARAVLAWWPEAKFRWGWGAYCRPVRGSTSQLSTHGSSQGVDLYPPVEGGEYGTNIANRLAELWAPLGLQYIIWNHRCIGGAVKPYRPEPWSKWRAYTNSAAGPHKDHLHIELTKNAANVLTFDYVLGVLTGGQSPKPNDTNSAVVARSVVPNARPDVGAWPTVATTAIGHVTGHGADRYKDLLELGVGQLAGPVVDIVSTGISGCLLTAADGGVFALGDARPPSGHQRFYADMGGRLDRPIVAAQIVQHHTGRHFVMIDETGATFDVGLV